jgi:hypothetical protein
MDMKAKRQIKKPFRLSIRFDNGTRLKIARLKKKFGTDATDVLERAINVLHGDRVPASSRKKAGRPRRKRT